MEIEKAIFKMLLNEGLISKAEFDKAIHYLTMKNKKDNLMVS